MALNAQCKKKKKGTVLFPLTSKTDANNVIMTYVYDALNRLITIQFPDITQNGEKGGR